MESDFGAGGGGVTPRPLKPPRGNKVGGGGGGTKETGILMRVIKTLSSAASTDHRDREKTKLEKDFKKSDAQLDGLLATRQPSLSSVMQLFSHVCGEVGSAKERIKTVKGSLQQCKMLLQCRREELQRLWLEGIEHKHALQIFAQIEKLREGGDNFSKLLNRKQYIPAVEVLMDCLQSWTPSLDQIEGLHDLRDELKLKRDKIYETLKEELYREIYHNLNKEPFEKRQGSGAHFSRGGSDRLSSGKMAQIKARKIFMDFGQNANPTNFGKNADSQEHDSFITTVVDCMVRLEEVPRFVKDLRHNLEENLMAVVNSASRHIIEYGDASGVSEPDTAIFQKLIQLIFTQFRSIVRSHALILRHLEQALGKQKPNVKIHNEEYLWTKVQAVLQSTLKIYFGLSDSKAESNISGNSEFMDTTLSINSYFVKRRAQRAKRPLFKFKYSLHGLNVNDYVVQGSDMNRSAVDRHRFLVCKPSPRNLIAIYSVVQELCSEIEQTTNGQKCELRKFMGNNVNKVFVQQIYKEISDAVESAKKNPDFWKDCISLDESKALKAIRPLLQSVVHIGRNVQEVIRLANELPSHCDQLARMLHSILSSYSEACQTAYQGIVQPDVDDKAVISSSWVKDTDIQRLLKSLPNWLKLLKAKEGSKMSNQSMDESPEDVRNQNLRESDLLTGLFYGKTVQRHEIITDTKQMNQLAHLQESLEWFANQVEAVAKNFERLPTNNSDSGMKEHIENIYEMVTSFSDLGDVCLLVLHLEVRVHCFHFLVPMAQNGDFSPGVDTQNSDPEVNKLIRDLAHIQNILSASLPPIKSKYVFEGIGQLISTILIGCAEHIQRINDNGVKKMCRNVFAIQKTLSDITNHPEQSMDHARQFYELFTLSPEELVNGILEKGPQFKELEYMNALKLLFRSKPGRQKMHSLDDHLNRLSNILGDVGVVV